MQEVPRAPLSGERGTESMNRILAYTLRQKPSLSLTLATLTIGSILVGCKSTETTRDASVQAAARNIKLIPKWSTYAYRYPDAPPVLGADGLKAFVGECRRHVVVLAFWASWSQSGRDDIARLARLHDELNDQGLRIVACTFDPADEWATRTVPILQGAGASFPCVVIPKESRSQLRGWLAADWSYDLPARFVIDQRGEIVGREFSGQSLDAIVAQARQALTGSEPVSALANSKAEDHSR